MTYFKLILEKRSAFALPDLIKAVRTYKINSVAARPGCIIIYGITRILCELGAGLIILRGGFLMRSSYERILGANNDSLSVFLFHLVPR